MTASTIPHFDNYYNEAVYMTSDVETGVLFNRSGKRMLALTNDFLLGLHRALESECGERAALVLRRCGKRWGKDFAEGLDDAWSEFYGHPAREFPLALFQSLLIQEFAHNGWGILEVDYDLIDDGIVQLTLCGAIMAEIDAQEHSYHADVLTSGILASIFSHFLGRELECLQIASIRGDSSIARFVLADPQRLEKVESLTASGTTAEDVIVKLQNRNA